MTCVRHSIMVRITRWETDRWHPTSTLPGLRLSKELLRHARCGPVSIEQTFLKQKTYRFIHVAFMNYTVTNWSYSTNYCLKKSSACLEIEHARHYAQSINAYFRNSGNSFRLKGRYRRLIKPIPGFWNDPSNEFSPNPRAARKR